MQVDLYNGRTTVVVVATQCEHHVVTFLVIL